MQTIQILQTTMKETIRTIRTTIQIRKGTTKNKRFWIRISFERDDRTLFLYSDDDDDEDEEAELMRELERIKKEREEEALRKQREEEDRARRQQEAQLIKNNPLLEEVRKWC